MDGPFIFLDIDGVLNSATYFYGKKRLEGEIETDMVDEKKVKLLKEIVDKSGAKIIVSSSWRGPLQKYIENKHPGDRLNASWCTKPMKTFKKHGIEFAGFTDHLYKESWYKRMPCEDGYESSKFDEEKYEGKVWGRGYEILCYIKDHDLKGHFVVLDDDSWDLLPFLWNGSMVHTTWQHGLTPKHVPIALDTLANGLTCEEWMERWPLFDPDYEGELPKIEVVQHGPVKLKIGNLQFAKN